MSYFATKYPSPTTEILHNLSVDWMLNYSGDSSEFGLWFTEPFEIGRSDILTITPWHIEIQDGASSVLGELAKIESLTITEQFQTIQELVGVWMVSGNDQGFIYSERFESMPLAVAEFDRLESVYSEWLDAPEFDYTEPTDD